MAQDIPGEKREDLTGMRQKAEFWFKFMIGIGGALYLLVLLSVMAVNISQRTIAVIIIYYELVFISYFLFISYMATRENKPFKMYLACLALADLIISSLIFGFNASYVNPGGVANPWQWHIGNLAFLFTVYPINMLLIFMFAGTIGLISVHLRPYSTHSSPA